MAWGKKKAEQLQLVGNHFSNWEFRMNSLIVIDMSVSRQGLKNVRLAKY